MNKTIKLMMVLIFALAMTACKKDVKPTMDDDTNNNNNGNNTTVVDTTPVRTDGLICCNPADLTDSNSLLSKRKIYFGYDQATIRSE